MTFAEWLAGVPREITEDSLWQVKAYRLALFLVDISWHDVTKLMRDKRTRGLSDQLYESVGSIAANISEGYSRGTGKARALFYEYALGSAREARGWYFGARHILGDIVCQHRIQLIAEILRLLLTMIPQQRSNADAVAEPEAEYHRDLSHLLDNVPLP